MLPERYRRLWQRRLRRRPLLPFLLAATVAVDLAFLVVGLGDSPSLWALIGAQAALIGIWITWAPHGVLSRSVAVVVVVPTLLAGLGVLPVDPPKPQDLYNERGIVLAALLASTTAMTAGGAFAHLLIRWRRPGLKVTRHRFGIASLLKAMLLVAVAVTLARYAEWPILQEPSVLILALAEAAAVALAIGFTRLLSNRAVRILLLVVLPTALGIAVTLLVDSSFTWYCVVYFSIQHATICGVLTALEPARHLYRPRRKPEAVLMGREQPIDITV